MQKLVVGCRLLVVGVVLATAEAVEAANKAEANGTLQLLDGVEGMIEIDNPTQVSVSPETPFTEKGLGE